MGQTENKTYLNKIKLRCRKAAKKAKTKILDEFCEVCGYHLNMRFAYFGKHLGGKSRKLKCEVLNLFSMI